MEEIGLFPLGIVLLPTEVVPLHIFEERYKELIGECLELEVEFGLVFADDDGGVREVGTRARVADVLERFDDGRLNVLVEGGERFRVERLTRGRSFLTAEIERLEDEPGETDADATARLAEAFRALAAAAGADAGDPDLASPGLSFELAARVELPVEAKQELLELRSEGVRRERVRELLDGAREAILAARRLAEAARGNGTRPR